MVCSPSQNRFSKPDQRASRTIAIKPRVRGAKQLDNGIDDTFVSSVREAVSFRFDRLSGLAGWRQAVCLRHEDTQSIRKYGQYHRPIARPILFWLNGDSFTLAGGLCDPSEDFESKFYVHEIVVGYVCIRFSTFEVF
jgi:hypothetical protein